MSASSSTIWRNSQRSVAFNQACSTQSVSREKFNSSASLVMASCRSWNNSNGSKELGREEGQRDMERDLTFRDLCLTRHLPLI